MKNVLMIATFFPPMGGIGVIRILKYVKYLRMYGWEPTVVTISNKFLPNKDDSLMKDIPDNLDIKRLEFNQKHADISIDFYKAMKNELPNIINEKKYDAVFVTGGPFFIIPIAKKIYKDYKIPYIIDLRDPWKLQLVDDSTFISKIKGNIKRFIKGLYEKSCFKYASKICTVNDTMTEEYKKEYSQYRDKFITISNGFDLDDYKNIETKQLEGFNIVYTGKFDTSAGFRDPTILFKALYEINKKDKRVNFIHVGKIENRVIEIAKKENCEDFCEFVGLKKLKETYSYCKGADILIAICGKQKIEQTGKIFDYICCKKSIIVVSTGESEIDFVCKKFNNIYHVKHDDVEGLKNAILNIYNKNINEKINDLESSDYSRVLLTKKLSNVLDEIER